MFDMISENEMMDRLWNMWEQNMKKDKIKKQTSSVKDAKDVCCDIGLVWLLENYK